MHYVKRLINQGLEKLKDKKSPFLNVGRELTDMLDPKAYTDIHTTLHLPNWTTNSSLSATRLPEYYLT
ncbi:unnamed protein product [Dovyalis caffra]|uniref:Uncharacterized protein n=1 Tax=Dovyalis caffra TaxID=77055 RepID=A0AAV1S5Q9_9ROSI|nr:unnamed protein product [Dovyalis caffra]